MAKGSRKRKKKKQNRAGKIFVGLMVVMFILVLAVQIVRLDKKNEEYVARQEELQEQLDQENQRKEDLEKQQQEIGSKAYIEDVAKSKLGLAYDNDIIFKEE